jgi:PAS domain S-box-containing protein
VTTARITNARRLEEDKIKASERLFRSAFEQVAVGMANLSLGGEWIRMNDQICKITGYSHDELSGTRYEKLYNSAYQAAAITEFRNITGGKKQDQCTTRKFLKKDGSSIWVECLLTLISDEQQQPLYIAVVVKDIDMARRTEHQLEYRNNELDTFIYRSSPDLRGPITTLMGLSDIARLDAPDMARTAAPWARCSRQICTGAAQNRFCVKTPATDAPGSSSSTVRSLRPALRTPASVTPRRTPAIG